MSDVAAAESGDSGAADAAVEDGAEGLPNAGNHTHADVPSPTVLASEISPPISDTVERQIHSPSPVPLVFVEKYGSNNRS